MVLIGVLLVGMALFMIQFLESGANTGRVELRDYRSYAPGSVEHVGEHNLFVVRLSDESFVALADMDQANREASGRQCRVHLVAATDPDLPELIEEYQAEFSEPATDSVFLFREDCNGAIYDAAGFRLDAEGPNLDRFLVGVNEDTRELVVDISDRTCTQANPSDPFDEIEC